MSSVSAMLQTACSVKTTTYSQTVAQEAGFWYIGYG